MRLLIVEDEAKTANFLRKGLTESDFRVSVARDGAEGLYLIQEQAFDLIILDIMVPRVDGWQLLSAIRERQDTPVLFLTARDAVDDRVRGLEMGADDYLVKPFAYTELLARIRTLLKRGPSRELDQLVIGDVVLDVPRRQVSRAGERITLTAKEFSLLELLMTRAGEVLSRGQIADALWDMNLDSDTQVVESAIRRLRSKIDRSGEPSLIRTVRGFGYTLENAE